MDKNIDRGDWTAFKLKLFLFIIAGIFLALTIEGCGGKKEEQSKKTILRWSGYGAVGYDEFRMQESEKFEKLHPEVEVKYEPIVGDFQAKMMTQIAGKTAPDMFFCTDLQTYTSKGALVDLTKWVAEDSEYFHNFHPALLEDQRWNGKVYALPGNCNVTLLYYNKDLFDEEGLSYPDENWTWEDLLAAAKRLTKRNEDGRIIQYGLVTPLHYQQLMLYVFQNGGKIWSGEGSKCVVNSQETRHALEFWRNMTMKYNLAPRQADIIAMGGAYHGYADVFFMGKSAMYCGWSYEVSQIKMLKKSLNWDATLMPIPEPGKKRLSSRIYISMGVWSGSKSLKLAYELIKFMSAPERIKRVIEFGDTIPLYTKGEDLDFFLSDPTYPDKARSAMLESLKTSKSLYHLMINPKVSYIEETRVLNEVLEKFVIGMISEEETLKEIEGRLNTLMEKK